MMHIEQRQQGWTVVNDDGKVMLKDSERRSLFCGSRQAVLNCCHATGLYECREGNPEGLPAGTLLELIFSPVAAIAG